MARVVVTGVGMVTACGNDRTSSWESVLSCNSGVAAITQFDAQDLPVQIAAEVKNFSIGDSLQLKDRRRAAKFIQYCAKATQEALHDSEVEITLGEHNHRQGCVIGVGMGGVEHFAAFSQQLRDNGAKRTAPFYMPYALANMATGILSKEYHFKGPSLCTASACASGTQAIGLAYSMIKSERAEVMICGGAEAAISPLVVSAFSSMEMLSTRNESPGQASRPFDRTRDGFVLGEGSGILIIEELKCALKRRANIYAEIVGFGMSGSALGFDSLAKNDEGAKRCMQAALTDARIDHQEIDYISAYGIGGQREDAQECLAIQKIFKDRSAKIPITATKGVTGNCIGAAGGIDGSFLALAIQQRLAPPIANFEESDLQCDFVTGQPREFAIKYALANSFGFGGANASIIFKKFSG